MNLPAHIVVSSVVLVNLLSCSSPPTAQFRCIGTEPFWGAVITDTSIIFTTPEVRERWQPVRPDVQNGTITYRTTDVSGKSVVIVIRKGRCSDGMSDHVYEFTATLERDGRTLKGCAREFTGPVAEALPQRPVAAPAVTSGSAGSGTAAGKKLAVLKGTVTYLQRIALAPDAVVQVTLRAAGSSPGQGIIVGRQTVDSRGRIPVAFEIVYDPAVINPAITYAVDAEILVGGNVLFRSAKEHPVITKGNPTQVEIILAPAR